MGGMQRIILPLYPILLCLCNIICLLTNVLYDKDAAHQLSGILQWFFQLISCAFYAYPFLISKFFVLDAPFFYLFNYSLVFLMLPTGDLFLFPVFQDPRHSRKNTVLHLFVPHFDTSDEVFSLGSPPI